MNEDQNMWQTAPLGLPAAGPKICSCIELEYSSLFMSSAQTSTKHTSVVARAKYVGGKVFDEMMS